MTSDKRHIPARPVDALDAPTLPPASRAGGDASDDAHHRAAAATPAPGSIFAGYELLDEVARGAMGIVYRARQLALGRVVAVKTILDAASLGEEGLRRFSLEATAAAGLDHPGIVPVYEVGVFAGHPFYSMAFVEGRSLAELLRDRPLTSRRAAEVARDVARAIAHAHQHGVIHRDLKPANILIETSGAARVTDFGVCKLTSGAAGLTMAGELVGTPHFMPPEQAGGRSHLVTPAADVYSIGAVLYAMLTGRPPFLAANPVDVVTQVMLREPVPPRSLNPLLPLELELISLQCLAKSPADRYPTANALADDLDAWLEGRPISARPPGLLRKLRFAVRRHVVLASVSGTIALALVAVATIAVALLLGTRAQLQTLRSQLEAERIGAVRFARETAAGEQEELTLARYDMRRWTEAAERISGENPDVALQLSIEAVVRARGAGLDPSESALWRIHLAAEQERAPTRADARDHSEGLDDVLERARRQVRTPLSEFERSAYGIPPHDQHNTHGNDTHGKDTAQEQRHDPSSRSE